VTRYRALGANNKPKHGQAIRLNQESGLNIVGTFDKYLGDELLIMFPGGKIIVNPQDTPIEVGTVTALDHFKILPWGTKFKLRDGPNLRQNHHPLRPKVKLQHNGYVSEGLPTLVDAADFEQMDWDRLEVID
jgi:hypothetical protein